jgi:hypothetical protein
MNTLKYIVLLCTAALFLLLGLCSLATMDTNINTDIDQAVKEADRGVDQNLRETIKRLQQLPLPPGPPRR